MKELNTIVEDTFPTLKPYKKEKVNFGKANSSIVSISYTSPLIYPAIRYARICKLDVPGKFIAKTLVIYPSRTLKTPIFGTEFLKIGTNKVFGATDFHPLTKSRWYEERYIFPYLKKPSSKDIRTSKFYDLSTFFSSRFYLQKSTVTERPNFYEEYLDHVEEHVKKYKECLYSSPACSTSPTERFFGLDSVLDFHKAYDKHMAENDPARGILKAYFSEEFAEEYISTFLFPLSNK